VTARRLPRSTPPVVSRALLSGWLIRLPASRRDLARWLSTLGPLHLAETESRAGEQHMIWCELWRVQQGETQAGSLGQHQVSALFGAAAGGMFGAAVGAWAAALTPSRPARSASERAQSAARRGFEAGRARGAELAERLSRGAATKLGSYYECMLCVPDVVLGLDETRHTFICGMYSDSLIARWVELGLRFGYDKRAARFEIAQPGHWSVFDRTGQVLSFRETPRARGAVNATTLRSLDETAALPLLGLTPTGAFARSWLHRSFSTAEEMEVASGVIDLRRQALPLTQDRYPVGPGASATAIRFSRMPASVTYPRSV